MTLSLMHPTLAFDSLT